MTKGGAIVDSTVGALTRAIVLMTTLFLMSPIFIVVPMSFDADRYLNFPPSGFSLHWYQVFFQSADWRASFMVSLEVAVIATILSLALGLPAAFGLVRSRLPSKPAIVALLSLPLVFPVIASAVAVYYVFAKLHLVGTVLGLAVAHTILALPVVILPMMAALQRFNHRLEWQAMNLGASDWRALRTVTFPLLRPTVYIVALFAFVTSFDEIVFAIFLSGGGTVTLPKRVWEGLRFEINPTVAVVATLLFFVSSAVVALAAILQHRTHLSILQTGKNIR